MRTPKTISDILPGALVPGRSQWRIRGSGVNSDPESCPFTRLVIEFLRSKSIPVEIHLLGGPGSDCDMYTADARFLDGGLAARTGNYIGLEKGAWVEGSRAALYVALGLDLMVPKRFYEAHDLSGTTLEQLEAALKRGEAGRQSVVAERIMREDSEVLSKLSR